MMTITIQIGNSDDKLTQEEWSSFCQVVNDSVKYLEVHFTGYSLGCAPWQNACWVAAVHAADLPALKDDLRAAALRYRQDSIAVTVGETEFLKP